jgi:monofunctional biosynthetic peptidoglycan transglycosylase
MGGIFIILATVPLLFILVYAIPGTKPVSTPMFTRAVMLQPVERQWRNLDDIDPVLAHSVLVSEDGQFCFHSGVDWNELNAVIDDALDGEKTRGASTLPMQTVKNLFLWPHRSFVRKFFEIPYSLFADLVWSKRRMMEIYLNIAEWNEGVYGAEAASQYYFKRSASQLTRQQSALLAVTLPNPKKRNAAKPSASLRKLAKVVEQRALQSGAYIKCLQ